MIIELGLANFCLTEARSSKHATDGPCVSVLGSVLRSAFSLSPQA